MPVANVHTTMPVANGLTIIAAVTIGDYCMGRLFDSGAGAIL